jgi:hypothetical protein
VTAVTAGVSKPATFHLTNTSVGRAGHLHHRAPRLRSIP